MISVHKRNSDGLVFCSVSKQGEICMFLEIERKNVCFMIKVLISMISLKIEAWFFFLLNIHNNCCHTILKFQGKYSFAMVALACPLLWCWRTACRNYFKNNLKTQNPVKRVEAYNWVVSICLKYVSLPWNMVTLFREVLQRLEPEGNFIIHV